MQFYKFNFIDVKIYSKYTTKFSKKSPEIFDESPFNQESEVSIYFSNKCNSKKKDHGGK